MAEVNKETKQIFLDLFIHPSLHERFLSLIANKIREDFRRLGPSESEDFFGPALPLFGRDLTFYIWSSIFMPEVNEIDRHLNAFIDEIVVAVENQKEKSENALFKKIFGGNSEASKS